MAIMSLLPIFMLAYALIATAIYRGDTGRWPWERDRW